MPTIGGVKLTIARQLDAIFVSFSFENWILRNPSRYAALKVHEGEPSKPDTAAHWPRQRRLLEAGHTIMVLPRKEVIQPHLPVRLPCYDFTPLTLHTFDASLQKVRPAASGADDSGGVTGGVYKARERIHRGMLIRDY